MYLRVKPYCNTNVHMLCLACAPAHRLRTPRAAFVVTSTCLICSSFCVAREKYVCCSWKRDAGLIALCWEGCVANRSSPKMQPAAGFVQATATRTPCFLSIGLAPAQLAHQKPPNEGNNFAQTSRSSVIFFSNLIFTGQVL